MVLWRGWKNVNLELSIDSKKTNIETSNEYSINELIEKNAEVNQLLEEIKEPEQEVTFEEKQYTGYALREYDKNRYVYQLNCIMVERFVSKHREITSYILKDQSADPTTTTAVKRRRGVRTQHINDLNFSYC